MTNPQPFRQPPRGAEWLLGLFVDPKFNESIHGDLQEEFSELATGIGIRSARGWFWRQTLKTILASVVHAFRTSPWIALVAVAGAYWLIGFSTRWSEHALQTFLNNHHYYELRPDSLLLRVPLEEGRVVVCAVVGALVALMAKRVGMAVVLALVSLQAALFLIAVVSVIASGREWRDWFLYMLLWNGLCWIATILGATLVAARRAPPKAGPAQTA